MGRVAPGLAPIEFNSTAAFAGIPAGVPCSDSQADNPRVVFTGENIRWQRGLLPSTIQERK